MFEDAEYEIVNNASRTIDGRFSERPYRRFRADGKQRLERDRQEALAQKARFVLGMIVAADTRISLGALTILASGSPAPRRTSASLVRRFHRGSVASP